jgi:triacylglycerol lipase
MSSKLRKELSERVIADAGEVAFVVHSEVVGPIRDMTFLQRALLFAELSMIAYNDPAETRRAAKLAGFTKTTFYDHTGTQAYQFSNRWDRVIACRGTEPNEWNDIHADANAATVVAETVGKVHRGFKREVDDLWPMLEETIVSGKKPLWFCGHSLGGAMATICSSRCFLSHIDPNPEQLYTYGSPRVGDNTYINHVKMEHFRFVNNNDIVTRVPPLLFGYRHGGSEIYINRKGYIRKLGQLMKRRDRFKGFIDGLLKGKIDHFQDHSIHNYIDALQRAVETEREKLNRGGKSKTGREYATGEREAVAEPEGKAKEMAS